MKNNTWIVLAFLLLVTSLSYAQAPGFDDTVDDVAPIPGLVIAIAAAIGIGVAKLRSKK